MIAELLCLSLQTVRGALVWPNSRTYFSSGNRLPELRRPHRQMDAPCNSSVPLGLVVEAGRWVQVHHLIVLHRQIVPCALQVCHLLGSGLSVQYPVDVAAEWHFRLRQGAQVRATTTCFYVFKVDGCRQMCATGQVRPTIGEGGRQARQSTPA